MHKVYHRTLTLLNTQMYMPEDEYVSIEIQIWNLLDTVISYFGIQKNSYLPPNSKKMYLLDA